MVDHHQMCPLSTSVFGSVCDRTVSESAQTFESQRPSKAVADQSFSSRIHAVRDATVVIVNPTHLANALRYVEGEDDAPLLVAKGEGDLARRIVEAAHAYGIPVVQDVPVAHALAEIAEGDSIPPGLYEAVAAILRDIMEQEESEDT